MVVKAKQRRRIYDLEPAMINKSSLLGVIKQHIGWNVMNPPFSEKNKKSSRQVSSVLTNSVHRLLNS